MSQPWTLLLCGLGRHGAIGARPSPACRPGEERCWEEEARLSHPCARRPSSPVVSADAALQPTHTRGRDLSAVRQGKPHAAIGARTGTSSSPPLQPPLDKRMDRSQSGSPEGTSVWPRRPSRRHRRRMRALKKKLEKMHLEQPSEKKNSQPSLPSSITRRLRRRARCLVWQITQAVLEEDDPEKSPRAQKRQLLRLYDGAPEHCEPKSCPHSSAASETSEFLPRSLPLSSHLWLLLLQLLSPSPEPPPPRKSSTTSLVPLPVHSAVKKT
ncbi:uncharacterized protein LOC143653578 isoform X2 [Tamandua tetradactyla]|uniref:uncharacterized protein LOC143653578 isoform X2 n=1 Tax=Tamandua tetradactyla TaxID=48850 RepID=UPI004053AED7